MIEDNRPSFLSATHAVRVRWSFERAGEVLHISVREITLAQVRALEEMVKFAMPNGYGNLIIEIGSFDGQMVTREFAKPSDIRPMLRLLGVVPVEYDGRPIHPLLQAMVKRYGTTGAADARHGAMFLTPTGALINLPLTHPDAIELAIRDVHEDR